jgi:putative ABC transport system substrate-binding protein
MQTSHTGGSNPSRLTTSVGVGPRASLDRRVFLAIALGALATPSAADAQHAGKISRIGILANVAPDPSGTDLWGAFVQGLRELGYVDGQNVIIEQRSCEGQYDRLPALAAELVRLNVDVIVVPAGQNARAAQQATRTIPILAASFGDPTSFGLVASYARPGGNITGLSFAGPELVGKQLQLLREMLPGISKVAVLTNPTNPLHSRWVDQASIAARSLQLELQRVAAREPQELDGAFTALARAHAGAVAVVPDGMFLLHRARIADLEAKRRIPAMYALREHVEAGGLAFYGASLRDNFRRIATYVDKILKGATPRDLPIEQPMRFELVVNTKTARQLGLTLPQSFLVRADQLID